MLGPHFRLQFHNGTGVTVTVTAKATYWKFASGAKVDSTEQTLFNAVATTTGSYQNSAGVNNASDLYLGMIGTVLFDIASSSTGLVRLILQESTDGGTTWPSNGEGLEIASNYFSASATDVTTNFRA